MKRDRLATVLALRERVELQRLAERAAAQRQQALATRALGTAIELRSEAAIAPGTELAPAELASHRVQVIALDDLVEAVEQKVHASADDIERATQRLVEAAVERRSVERLRQRREVVEARAEARRDGRRLDEVGLQVWRRSS